MTTRLTFSSAFLMRHLQTSTCSLRRRAGVPSLASPHVLLLLAGEYGLHTPTVHHALPRSHDATSKFSCTRRLTYSARRSPPLPAPPRPPPTAHRNPWRLYTFLCPPLVLIKSALRLLFCYSATLGSAAQLPLAVSSCCTSEVTRSTVPFMFLKLGDILPQPPVARRRPR